MESLFDGSCQRPYYVIEDFMMEEENKKIERATQRSLDGQRFLEAGKYEDAIRAFDEAITLGQEPQRLRRLLNEAKRRLWAEQKSKEKTRGRVSKTFYMSSIIVGYVVGLALLIAYFIPLFAHLFYDSPTFLGQSRWELLVVGRILLLYSGVVSLILLYKAWKAIQPGNPRTTPGKAVGFLFIPYFNIYWLFQAYWGFAKDHNKYVSQTGATNFQLSEGLFLAFSILLLVIPIPFLVMVFLGNIASFVGFGALIAYAVLYFIVVNNLCDAVNHLAQAKD